jgi:hypothetical protein
MTQFEYISQNIDRTKSDARNGIIPVSIITHWAIYCRYDLHKRSGYNKCEAISFTSLDFNMQERSIYRIIKEMESEYETT